MSNTGIPVSSEKLPAKQYVGENIKFRNEDKDTPSPYTNIYDIPTPNLFLHIISLLCYLQVGKPDFHLAEHS